jgi:hypothetical protein
LLTITRDEALAHRKIGLKRRTTADLRDSVASKQERGHRGSIALAAPSGIADPRRLLWSCVAGS